MDVPKDGAIIFDDEHAFRRAANEATPHVGSRADIKRIKLQLVHYGLVSSAGSGYLYLRDGTGIR